MSKVVSIGEGGNVTTLVSFRSPTKANDQLVRELNALGSVDVRVLDVSCTNRGEWQCRYSSIIPFTSKSKRTTCPRAKCFGVC